MRDRSSLFAGILIGIAATIVIALLGTYIGVRFGLVAANADRRPSALERWAAQTSLEATLSREAPQLVNPLAANDATLLAGVKIYAANCALCHGDSSGRPSVTGSGLYQRAPTLGRHGVEDDPDGETYWKATHGIRFTGMPSFGRTLSDTERWQVTTFLKHMNALPPVAQRAWKAVHVAAAPRIAHPN